MFRQAWAAWSRPCRCFGHAVSLSCAWDWRYRKSGNVHSSEAFHALASSSIRRTASNTMAGDARRSSHLARRVRETARRTSSRCAEATSFGGPPRRQPGQPPLLLRSGPRVACNIVGNLMRPARPASWDASTSRSAKPKRPARSWLHGSTDVGRGRTVRLAAICPSGSASLQHFA